MRNWKRGISKENQINVPRPIVPVMERGITHSMHCFADVGKEAYHDSVYLV